MKAPFLIHPLHRFLSWFLAVNFFLPPSLPLSVVAEEAIDRIVINEGDKSRSIVTTLALSLRTNEQLLTTGTRLQRLGFPSLSDGLFSTQFGTNIVTLTFTNGSPNRLADGNYLASFVLERTTEDGLSNGIRTNISLPLHQFFGDRDGDRDVDFLDTFFFRETWEKAGGDSGFDPRFDDNGDGIIDSTDRAAFTEKYFHVLLPQPAVFAHLLIDDGASPGDGLTSEPGVAGRVFMTNSDSRLRAGLRPALAESPAASEILPFDLTEVLAQDGTFFFGSNLLAAIQGRPLSGLAYRLDLQLVETNGLPSAWFSLPFTIIGVDCPWQTLSHWTINASKPNPAATSPRPSPGSAGIEGCSVVMREGNSFLVSMERTFLLPENERILSVSYAGLEFDRAETNRIKDAFEIAVLDAMNRPITFTLDSIDGSTPSKAARDACFNVSEGSKPLLAPGIAHANSTVYIDLSFLEPQTPVKLVLRLINNDFDRETRIAISEVAFAPRFPPGVAPAPLQPHRTEEIAVSGGIHHSKIPPQFTGTEISEQTHGWQKTGQAKSMLHVQSFDSLGRFPIATNIKVNSNFLVEVFARVDRVAALAFPPPGSAFGNELYASTSLNPAAGGGPENPVFKIDSAGRSSKFASLLGEADAWAIEFSPQGSSFGDYLYVSAHGRDNGRGPFNSGGTIQRIDRNGNWTDYSSVGDPDGPKLPNGIGFGFGTAFGDYLYVANSSGGPADLIRFTSQGTREAYFDRNFIASGALCFGSGPWDGVLLMPDTSEYPRLKAINSDSETVSILDANARALQVHFQSWRISTNKSVGTYIYATAEGRSGTIYRINPRGEAEVFATGFDDFVISIWAQVYDGMEFSQSGNELFVANWRDSTIYRITPRMEPTSLYLSIHESPASVRAGTDIMLSGQVGYSGGFAERGETLEVTINGVPVEAVDQAGQFYARHVVQPGTNRFLVLASDELGQNALGEVEIVGAEPGPPGSLQDLEIVSASVVGDYGPSSFAEASSTLYAELAIENTGQFHIQAPLYVGVSRISDPSVTVLASDRISPEGLPSFDFSELVEGGVLSPGYISGTRSIAFHNPNRVQFTYDLMVLGQFNHAPLFTTTPILAAVAGRPYQYAFNARDPDGDALVYSLVNGPANFVVSEQAKKATWQPTTAEVGNHPVRLRAEDGRGGSVEQEFLLSVASAPSNRPPVFSSQPVMSLDLERSVQERQRPAGRILVANDDWTLSDHGFDRAPDTERFVSNLTSWFLAPSEKSTGRFFAPSRGFFLNGTRLRETMRALGHSWETGDLDFSLQNLLTYDALFLVGPILGASDASVLIPYVEAGGNVYVGAGSDEFGDWYREALYWNNFLLPFNLDYDGSHYNPFEGALDVSSDHPVFNGISRLYQNAGNSVEGRTSSDPRISLLASHQGEVLYAAFDGKVPVSIYEYRAEAIDPDGDALKFSLLTGPAGMTLEPETGRLRWFPSVSDAGEKEVAIQVDDGQGGSATQRFIICVLSATDTAGFTNAPPLILRAPISSALVNQPLRFELRAVDPENQPVQFRLTDSPSGATLRAIDAGGQMSGIAIFEWTPTLGQIGSNFFRVIAKDASGAEAEESFVLDVLAAAPNRPPHFTTLPGATARLGIPFLQVLRGADPDGDLLEFAMSASPEGAALTSTEPDHPGSRLLRWTPRPDQVGSNSFEFQLSDGRGVVATQRLNVTVEATLENEAPSILSLPPRHATAGKLYEYVMIAEDQESDPIRWRLLEGPAGMALDAELGIVRWNPTLTQLGTNSVRLEVEDALLGSSVQSWTIEVGCQNRSPQITSIPLVEAAIETPYLYALRASDPDGDALSFSFADTDQSLLPEGLTLTNLSSIPTVQREYGPAGALLRWLPAASQAGSHTIRVRVTDGRGGSDTQTFTLHVKNIRANRAPVIQSSPGRGVSLREPYRYTFRVADADGDVLTITSLLPLPSGASLSPPVTSAGLAEATLTWTPATVGAQEFILAARDPSGATASQRFTVTARANAPPRITSAPVTNATPDNTYRYDVTSLDADGDPVTYSLASAPSGMKINPLGQIIWTPARGQLGSAKVTVHARDEFGGSDTQAFNISVVADTEPPSLQFNLIQGLINPDSGEWAADLGSRFVVQLAAVDNVGVASRNLFLGSTQVPLDARGVASIPVERGGFLTLRGVAADFAGNSNSTTRTVLFRDPNAESTSAIIIHSPTNNAVIRKPVPITASITSLVDIASISWGFAPASEIDPRGVSITHPAFIILGTTNVPVGTRSLASATLGTFDPTTLQNDSYVLAVAASDINGNSWTEPVTVSLEGDLKFGEFRVQFTDLAIPVAGLPIQVTRVYDSRLAGVRGDFGFGWSLGVQDAKIRESLDKEGYLRPQARVYLNGPDGKRLGFTFAPDPFGALFAGVFWRPRFTADPGVFDRLEAPGEQIAYPEGGGFAAAIAALSDPYNPASYFLTTKDGTRYEYEQGRGLRNVTDLSGNRLVYSDDGIFHYNAGNTAPDQSVRFVRDPQGRISEIVSPDGSTLRYGYDGRGDLRSFSDQVTNTTKYVYSVSRPHFLTNIVDSLERDALRLEYDEVGRLSMVRDGSGNPISQDFEADSNTGTFTDANGNVTVAQFDERGNETVRMLPGVFTNYFVYDGNNNLLSSTNGRGYSTNYTYDLSGNVTSITDALSNRTTIVYNSLNKPTAVTNALGQALHLDYNAAGQLTQVVNNAGFVTRVTRDPQGRVTSLTDATGTNTTFFDYESGCACGRPGKVTNPDGSFRLYEYNALGQTNRIVNELGAETLFHFDDSGKLLWKRDALSNFTHFYYRGPLLTNIVDALGRSTRFEYDALNRTNKIIDAEGGVVEFRYDGNGNRTHVIDAVTNVTRFVYDSANRVTNQIDTFGRTNFFAFDPAGNRIEAIDRNGKRRTFAYDALNRMTNELWWEGTNVVRSIEFQFNELGVQTLAADPAARYEYGYDELNRLERVLAKSEGVPDFTLVYNYSKLGQVESVTDNWGVRVGSIYDNRGRLSNRTWQGGGADSARVDFHYDETGNRTFLERFSDLEGLNRIGFTTNAYNHAGIVTNITHRGAAGEELARYDYGFDAAYQIRHWAINGAPSAFDYDRTGQLTNAVNATLPNEEFRFDANGNRTGPQSGGNYTVGGNNQIRSDGKFDYGYDFEGNMTSRTNLATGASTRYEFDHRNRLVAVTDRDGRGTVTQTVGFAYDAMNRRLSKTANGVVKRFLYNGDDSWADLDGTGTVTARYLHGERIDELLARSRASDGRGWYLTDHLGTVRDIANAAGAVVAHVDYSSFGQALGVSNPAAVDRFLFTGRELDEEAGLYFYRARYYSSDLGRFLSEDPIGFESGDRNLFRYVGNLPVFANDPYGLVSLVEYKTTLTLAAIIGATVGTVTYTLCVVFFQPNGDLSVQKLAKVAVTSAIGAVSIRIGFLYSRVGFLVRAGGKPYPGLIGIGIAAASFAAEAILKDCDFVSLGLLSPF